ncbi:hypothetical protein XMIN_4543 [Xanthomonas citri pv. mangiferaeindicae LMG 941]|nr:hypothetical protein XMIN_4543 [Xanthomonas citri pv. mangiferaeindicae LMG 941]
MRLIDAAAHQPTVVGHHRCDRHLDDAARGGERGVLRVGADLRAGAAGGGGGARADSQGCRLITSVPEVSEQPVQTPQHLVDHLPHRHAMDEWPG